MQGAPERLLTVLVLLIVIAGAASPAAAQVPATIAVSDTVWQIRLADGSSLIGQVAAVSSARLTIRTAAGATAEVDRASVVAMSVARGTIRDGRAWPEDPNLTRLFFGPTGRMLGGGEGYAGVFELFLPFLSYGITDYITIAGGTPIIPDVIGRIWYVAPKVGGEVSPNLWVSGGILAFTDLTADSTDVSSVGIAYLSGTAGSDDRAVTAGVGFGFAGTEVESRPMFMLGGESRVSPRIKLITENYWISFDNDGSDALIVLTGGVRVIGDRLSADAGIGWGADSNSSFCCVPLVNFVYNFGSRR